MTIQQELDLLVDRLPSIPPSKRYWLIRTQGGQFYESFREANIIALDHDEVSFSFLEDNRGQFGDDSFGLSAAIRTRVAMSLEEKKNSQTENSLLSFDDEPKFRKASLIANQIYKFVFEIKSGDIVLIPSYNSDVISFGIVAEDFISNYTPEESRKFNPNIVLKKRVKWVQDISRIELDPYLFKMFFSHQAVVDCGRYAEIIERSLRDFFILDDEAHLIINVQAQHDITAADVFGMGSELLSLVDAFAQEYGLDISSKDLEVTINLNSPGKIDLKSKIKKVTFISAVILAFFGGGYESKDGSSLKTPGIPGLLKSIDEFRTHQQERNLKQQIWDKYKDSLQIKDPEDIIKLLKQFSDNKDVAK